MGVWGRTVPVQITILSCGSLAPKVSVQSLTPWRPPKAGDSEEVRKATFANLAVTDFVRLGEAKDMSTFELPQGGLSTYKTTNEELSRFARKSSSEACRDWIWPKTDGHALAPSLD